MGSTPPQSKPALGPLRAVSDVLDVVEDDLVSIQRDLVLAERVGVLALAAAVLAFSGVVVLLAVRRCRRRATHDSVGTTAPQADPSAGPTGPDEPVAPTH